MNDRRLRVSGLRKTLGLAAFVLALIVGGECRCDSGTEPEHQMDYTVRGFAMTGGYPQLCGKAPLLVLIFAIHLHWLRGGGWNGGQLSNIILPG